MRCFPIVLAFVFVSSTSSLEAKPNVGKKIAIVAGVDVFQDSRWHSLRYPNKDASDLFAALRSEFDTVVHIGKAAPLTKKEFLAGIQKLSAINTSDRDTVVVYLSTHGTLARNGRGRLERVFVFYDTDSKNILGTGVRYRSLLASLTRLRSKRRLLVLAACHSGAGKSAISSGLAKELRSLKGPFFSEPYVEAGEGQIVLSASAWGEPAREDDGLKNDVYTHFFLQALKGFDRNRDGATSALEAHDYARRRTIDFTKGQQRPTLVAEVVGSDPVILRGVPSRSGDPTVAAYSSIFANAVLQVNGKTKGVLPGGFSLREGIHKLRVMRPNAKKPLLHKQVRLTRGQTLNLASLVVPVPPKYEVYGGFGWLFPRRGRVADHYLSDYPVAIVGMERKVLNGFSLGLRLQGTHASQNVRLESGDIETRTSQDVDLLQVSLVARYRLLERRSVVLTAFSDVGFSFGRRRLSIGQGSSERLRFPVAGVGVDASLWFSDILGMRLQSAMNLLFLKVEGVNRITFADAHGASLLVRF